MMDTPIQGIPILDTPILGIPIIDIPITDIPIIDIPIMDTPTYRICNIKSRHCMQDAIISSGHSNTHFGLINLSCTLDNFLVTISLES